MSTFSTRSKADTFFKTCQPFSLSINFKFNFFSGVQPHFVFSATGASKIHLVSENPLIKRVFKGTGVVLAGIECSPKICDFRANGIPVQERVDFFDTLKNRRPAVLFVVNLFVKRAVFRAGAVIGGFLILCAESAP